MIRMVPAFMRGRLTGFIGLFLTACLTIALLTSSGLLMFSALTAGPGPDRFAATSLTVAKDRSVTITTDKVKKDGVKIKTKTKPLTGAAVLPPAIVTAVAKTAGVAKAVPDVAFPVDAVSGSHRLSGPNGTTVVAHGWSSAQLTPFTLGSGSAPGRGQAVVDASLGVAIGDTVQVTTKTGTQALSVTGITKNMLANQGALFVADDEASRISGLSGPTAVGIFLEPDAIPGTVVGALRARLGKGGEVGVFSGPDRIAAELPTGLTNYTAAVSVFGIMLGVTGFAALFVLVGSVGMIVSQRLRELALLRSIGATPRQLLRLLALETSLVSLVAGVPGVAIGAVVSRAVAAWFRTSGVVPVQFEVSLSPAVMVGATIAGVLVSALAALLAARRATAIAPSEALRESAIAPRPGAVIPIVATLVLAAGACAVLVFTPLGGNLGIGMSFIACALLLCALVAAGPLIVRLVNALITPASRLGGVAGRLAAAAVGANGRRTAAVAMPIMLLTGLAATLMLTSTLGVHVDHDQEVARSRSADTKLTSAGPGVPLATVDKVAAATGVSGVAATLPTTIMVDAHGKPEHYAAQGIATSGDDPLNLGVSSGSLTRLDPDSIAISSDLASAQHWAIGDEASLWLADATIVKARVAAVYERSRGFGDLVLPAGVVVDHDPRGLVSTIYTEGATPTDAELAAWSLRASRQNAPETADGATQQAAFTAIVVILVGFIGIAVVNAFALSIRARRREFTDLKLAGATARQLHRMVDFETAITVLIGLVLGCAVATAIFEVFGLAQDGRIHGITDSAGVGLLFGSAALLGLLAGIIPARLVVRARAGALAHVRD